MRIRTISGLMVLASFWLSGTLSGQPVFDVASIKPSPASFKPDPAGHVDITPGGVLMGGVTLRDCVKWAYGVRDDQVLGPAWIGTERYDIAAKAGGTTPVPGLRLMLRALLADRFGLALHHETRERPVFVMVVGESWAEADARLGNRPGYVEGCGRFPALPALHAGGTRGAVVGETGPSCAGSDGDRGCV